MALLDREVLDATELKLLMENKPLPEKPRLPHAAATGCDEHRPQGGSSGVAAGPGLYTRREPRKGLTPPAQHRLIR